MSIVTVIVTTPENINAERRLDKGWTIEELKCKLEPITGIPIDSCKLSLYQGDLFIGPIDDDSRLVGSYPIEDYMRLHAVDTNPHRIKNQYTDVSLVEKFELTDEEYRKRNDTVRAFKERNKLGRFSDEAVQQMAELEQKMQAAFETMKVGDRCEVQLGTESEIKRRGTIKFLGTTEFQPGLWVGVQYDEPFGKNDGSVQGVRYFTAPPKYGGFVRPNKVTVGDFPEEDLFGSDEELDELEEM
ncbi:CAP Gly-rich domain-containing protein [Dichotomocladium elegans]|nr:CAP Gly-rich domain-containing protein [Dichotomocladium elegans]